MRFIHAAKDTDPAYDWDVRSTAAHRMAPPDRQSVLRRGR
jgi:hypothetical protein